MFFAQPKETNTVSEANAMMREVKFDIGEITPDEYYKQVWLEEQMLQKKERQTEEKRKERVLAEFADNFDLHFERRRKELHDGLMKKIQQHEKAS